jgi:hypothetical protein
MSGPASAAEPPLILVGPVRIDANWEPPKRRRVALLPKYSARTVT